LIEILKENNLSERKRTQELQYKLDQAEETIRTKNEKLKNLEN